MSPVSGAVSSTMQVHPLCVADLFEHGERTHPDSAVIDYNAGELSHRTFAEVAVETRRLAAALAGLGVGPEDVVATLCWNTSQHVAAYFAVPCIGAVLHTLNLRLHPNQLAYIARHAGDRVVIVDADLVPLLGKFLAQVETVTDVVVIGGSIAELTVQLQGQVGRGRPRVHSYAALVEAAEPLSDWAPVLEDAPAALCYTTGTTGDPKGVAYSHRSVYLHTLMISTGSVYGFSDADSAVPVVPMFHANAWGWVHAAWLSGADLVLTGRFLQAPHLGSILERLRPTMVAAVPTVWSDLSQYAEDSGIDLTCLRVAVTGGSPLSPALARRLQTKNGVLLSQGWGMTETSPLLTYSRPPARDQHDDELDWTTRAGRLIPGVRARVVDSEGHSQPWDGSSQGEVEVAGNTVTATYVGDTDPTRFRDGWLRTGDLGVVGPGAWVTLKDRLKDGIKSGGEWISSVELENAIAEHPGVAEAAVVGRPDAKWGERPHAFVVAADDAAVTSADLVEFLIGRVAKWWVPDDWTFTDEIPRTSVGKPDKRRLRDDT